MHLTRNEAPTTWPIPRKGTKQLLVPKHNKKNGIPLLVIIRDMLKLGKTRKEVEDIMRAGKIKVNGKIVRDEKFAMLVLDIIDAGEKSYKLILENKKFRLEETKEKEKIAKIIGKKVLAKGKIQINLNDGRNFITKEKFRINDSVAVNFEGKIARKIELKENSKIIVIKGSHIGEEGKIEKLNEKNKTAEIKTSREKINLNLDSVMAV